MSAENPSGINWENPYVIKWDIDKMARAAGMLVESWMTNPPKPGLYYGSPTQLEAFGRAYAEQQTKRADAAENLLRVCFDQKVAAEQQTKELQDKIAGMEAAILALRDGPHGAHVAVERAAKAEQQTAELRAQRDAARLANTHYHAAAEQREAVLRAEVERLKGQIRAFARDAISSRPEQS